VTHSSIDWQWGEVDARSDSGALCLTHRRDGSELWVRNGRLSPGAGYAAAPATARRDLARVGAIVRLRERGRYLLHAAGAVDPRGRAWLLSGDSGSGKSTLAYALARSGWRILGDDGVVVETAGPTVIARAWRDPLMVSSALSAAFPEMQGRESEASISDPRRRAPVAAPLADRAPLAAVIFVHRAAALSVLPLSPVEALAALVRQSPWVILNDRHAPAHLAALQRISTLPAYRLGHTPAELHGIADVLDEVSV
jgi:hypothetical protein